LQRIALGVVHTDDMGKNQLVRLKLLALIEETGTDFNLTALGSRRLALRGIAPPKRPC
jgi:hypothetical protein